MKNVSVTLDEETVRWVRREAARRDVSVSRLIRDFLWERMRDESDYETAMNRYLARRPSPLKTTGPYPPRDELHDRVGLP